MNSRARVVLLLEDLEFGGTQRQALELASRTDPRLFEVELWMMRSGRDFGLPRAVEGLTRRVLSKSTTVGPESLLRLGLLLQSHPVDLLLLLTAIPNIWGRLLGRMARVPRIVATVRGEGSPFRQHEKLLWRCAHHHVCNSAALKTILIRKYGIPEDRISVIVNGIDPHTYPVRPPSISPPGKHLVLCVARMVPDKDLRTLLAAFELLRQRCPSASLLMVGDGPLRREICIKARQKIPRTHFQWLPGRQDLVPIYHQADLFVLSSILEGFPNVVMEAMACGLPVVATRVGGLQELVAHGQSGLLVNPGDPEALADAMAQLLSDPDRRTALGIAGRRRIETLFSIQTSARSHERLFLQLLESTKSFRGANNGREG